MSRGDDKEQLVVRLFKENDTDYLEFKIGQKIHSLNLNVDDNQAEIKAMFCDLLTFIEVNNAELILKKEEGFDNKLLEDVAICYIADLNNEIQGVRGEILDKYTLTEDQ